MFLCNEVGIDDSCIEWVAYEPPQTIMEQLAISVSDAGSLTLAICTLILLGYVGGLIGRSMLQI